MLRFFAGVASTLLLVAAGFFVWKGWAQDEAPLIPPPPPPAPSSQAETGPPAMPPAADSRTKEQKRFDRADRDKDGEIRLEELYQPRRRAFARLDTNGDGRLSFEEWAIKTAEKFAGADSNRDGKLDRAEYATTAPRRKTAPRQPDCRC